MEQKTSANDPYRIEAVDRALVLLMLLGSRGVVSVSDAARELEVAPSTAHRLLSTLCHRGFAVQGDKRLYHPGPELVGNSLTTSIPVLTRRVRPFLEKLFDEVGETVHLMVLVGAEVRFVDGIESEKPLRVGLRSGARMPAYTTSGGKAMLAEMDPSTVEGLHAGGLRPWPGEQVQSLEDLQVELDWVRQRRFGLNQDESEEGVTAIGASIGRTGNESSAALTIAIPTARVALRDVDRLTAPLLSLCARIRAELGLVEQPGQGAQP